MRRSAFAGVVLLCLNGFALSTAGAQGAAAKPTHPIVTTKTLYRLNPLSVFQALEKTWNTAGVKPPVVDAPNFTMSFKSAPMPPKFGNTAIERIVDCGGDKRSPLAKSTPLTMILRSVVKHVDDGAELATTMEVFPTDTTSGVVCVTTGVLEKKLEPNIATGMMSRGH